MDARGPDELDFDYVVIGSGFGGSVAALRLREKGYRVCVIEQGRRFKGNDFAATSTFCDGSIIPTNPGSTPSLNAAMAERCMSKIPARQ